MKTLIDILTLHLQKVKPTWLLFVIMICCCFYSQSSWAADQGGEILNSIADKFINQSIQWTGPASSFSMKIFYYTSLIALVWRVMFLVLKGPDLTEIMIAVVQFIMTFGFFYWLLQNFDDIFQNIMLGFHQLGVSATAFQGADPSSIITVGTDAAYKVFDSIADGFFDKLSGDTLMKLAVAGLLLFLFCLMAIQVLLALVEFYISVYAGIFALGFAGMDWTREWAKAYLMNTIALAVRYYGMILVLSVASGVFQDIIDSYSDSAQDLRATFVALSSIIVSAIITFKIVDIIPNALKSYISHIGTASMGAGQFAAMTGMTAAARGIEHSVGKIAKKMGATAAGGAAGAAMWTGRAGMRAMGSAASSLGSAAARVSPTAGAMGVTAKSSAEALYNKFRKMGEYGRSLHH